MSHNKEMPNLKGLWEVEEKDAVKPVSLEGFDLEQDGAKLFGRIILGEPNLPATIQDGAITDTRFTFEGNVRLEATLLKLSVGGEIKDNKLVGSMLIDRGEYEIPFTATRAEEQVDN